MAKILLIDDDPDVRTVTSALLKRHGHEVETASRCDEALDKLKTATPSLILLDVLLSGADGRELCREIKATPQTANVPVIMFSGHPGAAQQFESWGASDFIPKPFNTEMLLEKLNQQLSAIK